MRNMIIDFFLISLFWVLVISWFTKSIWMIVPTVFYFLILKEYWECRGW